MTTSSVAHLQVQCRRLLHNNVFAMKAWLENNVHSWPETDPMQMLDMQTDEVMQDKETGLYLPTFPQKMQNLCLYFPSI